MTTHNSALIEPAELATIMTEKSQPLIVLDASYAIGANGMLPEQAFMQMRIGEARFFDIDKIADTANPLPHMLPTPENFSLAAKSLGIEPDSFVVVYDQSGIAMAAARAWWMFRVFGHTNVRVLNGGLPAWVRAGLPLSTTAPHSPPPASQNLPVTFHAELVVTYEQMRQAVETSSSVILDARPPERFSALAPEPRPGVMAGHMPGAHNVPAGSLIDPETRRLIENHFFDDLIPSAANTSIITTCGSGVTACVTALALYEQEYKNVAVYDGSWTEWSQQELNSPIINYLKT